MRQTSHRVFFADSRNLEIIGSGSVALVVTSPPYPMIEMWDDCFSAQCGGVRAAIAGGDGREAFALMHGVLDAVWGEVHRVLMDGGIACINIGDATRTVGGTFRLYANHARVLDRCFELGFDVLPMILWRKTTNAPNKFMGSGMLPPAAYVTLEHEYILVLRKGGKRSFPSAREKRRRRESAFFWEERNDWFSDDWRLEGARQDMDRGETRDRSAAFPFELAYRLINMFSVKGDTVLDPFLGTGTTMYAAMASERSSIGVEIDERFRGYLVETTPKVLAGLNGRIEERLRRHGRFVEEYSRRKGRPKHLNARHGFPVVTSQEVDMRVGRVAAAEASVGGALEYRVRYTDASAPEEEGASPLGSLPAESGQLRMDLGNGY